MVVDAWTTFRTKTVTTKADGEEIVKDILTFQIDHAWLDKWPMIDALGQQVKLPPNCSVNISQDGIEFTRKLLCQSNRQNGFGEPSMLKAQA